MRAVRHQPLVRCLRLARFLRGRRVLPTWDVMAQEIGVSERTVRRYVAALNEAHEPIPKARPQPGEDDYPYNHKEAGAP